MFLPPFTLRPFDAPRPRLHAPRADLLVQSGAKTYGARAANGLLFLRDMARDSADFTLTVGAPLPEFEGAGLAPTSNRRNSSTPLRLEVGASPAKSQPATSQQDSSIHDWASEQIERGNVARYVLLPYHGEHYFREFPLFFRPDGTGWCRESWNRDDFAFEHDLSLHNWLEAPAPTLYSSAREIFRREVAPQLSRARLPADRNEGLQFGGGARADLRAVLRHAFALENIAPVGLIRATGQSETTFNRAGFWAARGESGEVEVWFDRVTGQRYREPWKTDGLRLSRRFWMLGDLAIDVTTPTGIYWDYHDRGSGRLSESPHARDFSLQFIADKLPPPAEARAWLADWLHQIGADGEILGWDEVETFEARESEPQRDETSGA